MSNIETVAALEQAQSLVKEFRPSMNPDVLTLWARDVVRSMQRLMALVQAGVPQPIETAPKDRRVILAYAGEWQTMQWDEGSMGEGEDWALWVYADELLRDACPNPDQPTFWLPLPESPE